MTSVAAKASLFETTSSLNRYPASSSYWRSVLQEIKLLYIQRQYKRCVARSSSILSSAKESIHPVYKVYLYFYAAISYEAIGRYAHDCSRNKIPLLHSAVDSFAACLAILPDKIPVDETLDGGGCMGLESVIESSAWRDTSLEELLPELRAEIESFSTSHSSGITFASSSSASPSLLSSAASRSTSPTESLVSSITDIIDKALDCPEDDPFLSDYDEHHGNASITEPGSEVDGNRQILRSNPFETERGLIPSPLHLRKSSHPLPLLLSSLDLHRCAPSSPKCQNETQVKVRKRPPPLPLPIKPAVAPLVPKMSNPSNNSVGSEPTSPARVNPPPTTRHAVSAAVKKYNASLTFLHDQITSSITSLHELITSITTLRQARAQSGKSLQRSASFWSFSPITQPSETSTPCLGHDRNATGREISSSGRESIQERVVRLRAAGWGTVGLKNGRRGWKGVEYYREFCGKVLDELYLDA
ncbi:uncharacterized protein BJX67DRAFT_243380 [Aspergillus lucknowensis]|uniref:Uncharacterized protein n=1 Tax=Aspergillus lucknowensis TaxID=176173 RepID=A0ABR4M2Y4_9EURO